MNPAPRSEGLETLPAHFRQERIALLAAGITTWQQLEGLHEARMRELAAGGLASERRLLRLRAQARLMAAANLPPQHASLLLHAGIAEVHALAEADPQRLQVQVNRFTRQLLGPAAPPLNLTTVRGWIQAAAASRPAN